MTKHKINILILLIIAFVMVGCSNTQKLLTVSPLSVPGHEQSISKIVDNSTEKISNKCFIYKKTPYQLNKENVIDIAKKLNITSETIQDELSFYTIMDNYRNFTIDKESGSYSFYLDRTFEELAKPINKKLSNADYIEIANKFVTSCGINRKGLSLENPKVYDYKTLTKVNADGTETETIVLKGVQYRHKDLEGKKILGVAPRLMIAINYKGEVVEFMNPWGTFEKYQEYPLITKSNALELLKKLDSKNSTIQGIDLDDTFIIQNTEIVYFNDPIGYDSLYLMPFYWFYGTNSKGQPVNGYVRAIDDKYVKVQTPEYYYPPQNRTENPDDASNQNEPLPESTSKRTAPETEQNAAKK
jgi:uncharacterized protein YkvS